MEPTVRVPSAPPTHLRVPPELEGLRRLAYNLYWTWHPRARGLYARIDSGVWARSHSPIPVLAGMVDWARLLDDPDFMSEAHRVIGDFDRYLANGSDHWFHRRHAEALDGPIAYFCAEYGLHESLGIYSGGLGVLAGDHMKTASDMALPLIGVGLLYRNGYFRQTIDADGHQEHRYPDYDLHRLPISRVIDRQGGQLTVTVEFPGRDIHVDVWVVRVGRVPVILLDTDTPQNVPADRPITHILYVRGREMRLHQELVLGIGGVRALRALGITPSAWHLNEGHSAFLLAERARELVAAGATFDDAIAGVGRNSVFTIHTPVSAGNERFEADLVRRVAGPILDGDGRKNTGGVPVERVLEIGRGADGDPNQFDMTAFSLRIANGSNAVSRLHAATANETWRGIVPHEILDVTNGVHIPTWVGGPIRELYARYLDADLDDLDPSTEASRWWERISRIPAVELWEAHVRQKREVAVFARGRLRAQFARHGEAPSVLEQLEQALDPAVLTIGFARRFATYKRANLIFRDVERLRRLLVDTSQPVQIIFAGKAHPEDTPGKEVLQSVHRFTRDPLFEGRVAFLEDYDMHIGHLLVQGVDLWLNLPVVPMEASGTSGMKAALNGVPQLSTIDGWWEEGFDGTNGWSIPPASSVETADAETADHLYSLLETQVVPRFYDRATGIDRPNGVPHAWVTVMKNAMRVAGQKFTARRMLEEYVEKYYVPSMTDSATPDDPPTA